MRVIQLVTHLNIRDAIGNEVLAMDDVLRQHGYETVIMASKIHADLKIRARQMDLSMPRKEDLILFHKANGDLITGKIAALPCKKVMIYHNITPAKYFFPYDLTFFTGLCIGRRQVRWYAPRMDACWADSAYNAAELLKVGVSKEKLAVLPILFSENESKTQPNPVTERMLKSIFGTKLVSVGRIVPNKKWEDVIKAYAVYREQKDPNAVLFLLGSWDGMEKYYAKLKSFAADLKLNDRQVVFAGKVTDEEKEAYYRNSDALLCLSEHEGFCIPPVEASARDLPVLAYKAAAVPETLGSSGLQFAEKDYEAMAEALARLKTDPSFRQRIIEGQRENLKRFDPERIRPEFLRLVKKITGEQTSGPREKETLLEAEVFQILGVSETEALQKTEAYETEKQQIPVVSETEALQVPGAFGSEKKERSEFRGSRTKSESFKPLWRIHNATYRTLSRGCTRRMTKQMFSRFRDLIKS